MQQLGVIGLGVMGANLARNAARNGARTVVYNRTPEKTDEFMRAFGKEGDVVSAKTLPEFVKAMTAPRAILLMVKAGDAVDAVIDELFPLLSKGDILIDAGNSHFRDTERREIALAKKGMHFVGMGVSGGEEGALLGPSMMPGGDRKALESLMPLFSKMSADDGAGGKCVTYIGPQGAGHFVKMVHNGIEYGIMQLIAEAYDVLKSLGKLTNAELATTFDAWSKTDELGSFLIEITAKIFAKKDLDTGKELIDLVVDAAGQKGTGKWTTEAAMDLGVAIPTITAAVDARIQSGDVVGRTSIQKDLPPTLLTTTAMSKKELTEAVFSALQASIISSYVQGFGLIGAMFAEKKWDLNLSEITRIWRGGCIIRSVFLQTLQKTFAGDAAAKKVIVSRLSGENEKRWRNVIVSAVANAIPVSATSASLSFYDTLRRPRLPQNLVQAQRDFFGAHTYRRVDKDGIFHTEWGV